MNHLKCIPARLSVYDALRMSKDLRRALIKAFTDPEDFKDQVEPIEVNEASTTSANQCALCMACIAFYDDDLLLESENHNRPLYVTCSIGDRKTNRILIDGGSAVNLLPQTI